MSSVSGMTTAVAQDIAVLQVQSLAWNICMLWAWPEKRHRLGLKMKFVAMMRAGDVTVSDFGNGKGLLFSLMIC